MNLDKETEVKIQEIQILEQNLHNILMQKQSAQFDLNEILNALQEVKNTSDEIYKTFGSVIIKSGKEDVLNDLEEKKKIIELRTTSFEKQEKLIETKLNELREDLKKSLEERQ